ncbi:MAG: hypothetical protein HUU16_21900 [Candidatus Omnitrophica bacterium]|nr:hypothetical protein [Candidatus Omnitrophota bacterium]
MGLRHGIRATGFSQLLAITFSVILASIPRIASSQVLWSTQEVWSAASGGNNHSYEYIIQSNTITWDQARAQAESRGGYLATIGSSAENWFIYYNLASLPTTHGAGTNENRWIGGYQPAGSPEPSGGWRWVTTEPFSFTAWMSGEPNNFGADGAENYLEMPRGSYVWNDFSNYGSGQPIRSFVVEYGRPVVDPPSFGSS